MASNWKFVYKKDQNRTNIRETKTPWIRNFKFVLTIAQIKSKHDRTTSCAARFILFGLAQQLTIGVKPFWNIWRTYYYKLKKFLQLLNKRRNNQLSENEITWDKELNKNVFKLIHLQDELWFHSWLLITPCYRRC